jgi:hypothetical protein
LVFLRLLSTLLQQLLPELADSLILGTHGFGLNISHVKRHGRIVVDKQASAVIVGHIGIISCAVREGMLMVTNSIVMIIGTVCWLPRASGHCDVIWTECLFEFAVERVGCLGV